MGADISSVSLDSSFVGPDGRSVGTDRGSSVYLNSSAGLDKLCRPEQPVCTSGQQLCGSADSSSVGPDGSSVCLDSSTSLDSGFVRLHSSSVGLDSSSVGLNSSSRPGKQFCRSG